MFSFIHPVKRFGLRIHRVDLQSCGTVFDLSTHRIPLFRPRMKVTTMTSTIVTETAAWKALGQHAREIQKTHLKNLLEDAQRCAQLRRSADGILLDFARQQVTTQTMDLLLELAAQTGLQDKIDAMRNGQPINNTENRPVLHYVLRTSENPPSERRPMDGDQDTVADVLSTRRSIEAFSQKIRSGELCGATGQPLTDVVVIGIGGSYLGTEFVYEALRTDPDCAKAAVGRRLRFLANVDPIDVTRALEDLDPATTLVVVVSKTFTTAETMLNARTVRRWLRESIDEKHVSAHLVAISSAVDSAKAFGIPKERVFPIWDWVGGRYSVSSAVGILPLALQFGYAAVDQFLQGARSIDDHFFRTSHRDNLPVLMGLLGVWNASFLGYAARAVLPYCQALLKFAPHIQQLDMESNGKRVNTAGEALGFDAGEIDFGEPGTNGQHSFYQLLHQGRVVPADFIGFRRSQQPLDHPDEAVSNHDELMSNFFAQPDALATGKSLEKVLDQEKDRKLAPHKVFPGNRPSNVLLLEQLTPYTTGQLLALYEHRTAVQGFVWGINSFDQWGVQLGKVTADSIRDQLAQIRRNPTAPMGGFNSSTLALLEAYTGK
jgi:glucose-6-phosphate isomerase